MKEILHLPLTSVLLVFSTFSLGLLIQRKTKISVLNPLLISSIICAVVVYFGVIPVDVFLEGTKVLTLFLPVATVLLASNIYLHAKKLKKYALPIVIGCFVGSLTSMAAIMGLCHLFGVDAIITASLIGKSTTTPIAIEITNILGGVEGIGVIAVLITGMTGSSLAPLMAKIFFVKNAVAEGIAIGTCSHVIGTSKAVELGEVQGAMSSVAIGISGLCSVLLITAATAIF